MVKNILKLLGVVVLSVIFSLLTYQNFVLAADECISDLGYAGTCMLGSSCTFINHGSGDCTFGDSCCVDLMASSGDSCVADLSPTQSGACTTAGACPFDGSSWYDTDDCSIPAEGCCVTPIPEGDSCTLTSGDLGVCTMGGCSSAPGDDTVGCDTFVGDTCCPGIPDPVVGCETDFGHSGDCITATTCYAPKLVFSEPECSSPKVCCADDLATPTPPDPTPPPDPDPIPSVPSSPPAPGAGGLVPCGGEADDPCGFEDFIQIIANFIEFLLVYIAIPLAACVFMYAGYLMMTAAGNTTKIAAGKNAFKYVLIGLIVAFAAWLIVEGLMTGLGLQDEFWLLG